MDEPNPIADLFASMPEGAQARLNGTRPEQPTTVPHAIQQLYAGMPAAVHAYLNPAAPEKDESASAPRWCTYEAAEGEFPTVRVFASRDDLLRYVGRHEGEEATMWCFFGIPMPYTKFDTETETRVIRLPDDKYAAISRLGTITELPDFDPQAAEFQLDGWLGPDCLASRGGHYCLGNEAIEKTQQARIMKRVPPKTPKPRSDWEEDDNNED